MQRTVFPSSRSVQYERRRYILWKQLFLRVFSTRGYLTDELPEPTAAVAQVRNKWAFCKGFMSAGICCYVPCLFVPLFPGDNRTEQDVSFVAVGPTSVFEPQRTHTHVLHRCMEEVSGSRVCVTRATLNALTINCSRGPFYYFILSFSAFSSFQFSLNKRQPLQKLAF